MVDKKNQSLADSFDNMVDRVRDDRQGREDAKQAKEHERSVAWYKVIAECRKLKEKLRGHPKIQSFDFSRDLDEVRIKVLDPEATRGHTFFLLTSQHPDGKYPGLFGAWLRQVGEEDKRFKETEDAVRELMRRLARQLA